MSGVPWLDIVLGLVLLSYAASGWRQGCVRSAFAIAGFLAGGALAMWVLPTALDTWHGLESAPWLRAGVIVAAVFVVAVLGQVVGGLVGRRLSRLVTFSVAKVFDALLGSVVSLVAAGLVLWLVAGAVRGIDHPLLSRQIGGSRVLAVIDDLVPESAGDTFADFRRMLEDRGFPRVFDGVASEPIRPVGPPPTGLGTSGPVKAAAGSVVRVDADAPSCREHIAGSGWVLERGVVVTNAHVVAGTDGVTVRVGGRGPAFTARVVLFDPDRDLAVLRVPELDAAPLPRGPALRPGEAAAVAGFPGGGPYRVADARARARLVAKGSDIYGRSAPPRDIYSLRVRVRPGNSGGPLLDTEGRAVGVVFASSLDDPETGYALTLDEVAADLAQGSRAVQPVATGACVRL